MKDLVANSKIVCTFKKWLQTESESKRTQLELRTTGALCLGNLARSGSF